MRKFLTKYWMLPAVILVVGIPFLIQRDKPEFFPSEDRVIIITPHAESIRYEFRHGFERWYYKKYGRKVSVDYRVIGGTSEIAKFIRGQYTNAFQNYWMETLGRDWSLEIESAYNNPRLKLDDSPEDDTIAELARRAFLESSVSCGIDLFFGGGTYDHGVQANMGNFVDAGLLQSRPDLFQETGVPGFLPSAIPQRFAGESYYDPEGRWYGTVLSSYGIIYNKDVIRKLGIEATPEQWSDLTDYRYFRQIAVCDPTKSGSMTQAFEMIVQQQMQLLHQELLDESGGLSPELIEERAVHEGWNRGMQLIQLISANARYFSDSSQKPNIDVAMGDCAAGMSIDFYGRFQQQNAFERSGNNRFGFISPAGGTTISADPIGLLRGAPNREVAVSFIEYVLSVDGQKLWNFEVGTNGGPELYALRRPPILPELYSVTHNHYRTDAEYIPYIAAKDFQYKPEWTARLFSELRTIIRICFIDVRKELVGAWSAIIEARREGRISDADKAFAIMQDLERISYYEAATTIDAALKKDKIEEVIISRELSQHFRQQYLRAESIARGN